MFQAQDPPQKNSLKTKPFQNTNSRIRKEKQQQQQQILSPKETADRLKHSLSTSSLAVQVDLPTLLMATQAYWPASSGCTS